MTAHKPNPVIPGPQSETRNPGSDAGNLWIPACAGMTSPFLVGMWTAGRGRHFRARYTPHTASAMPTSAMPASLSSNSSQAISAVQGGTR
jgi:hypothetical protein